VKKQVKFGVGIGSDCLSMAFLAWLGYGESKTTTTPSPSGDIEGSEKNPAHASGGPWLRGLSVPHRPTDLYWGEGRRSRSLTLAPDPLPDTFVDKSRHS